MEADDPLTRLEIEHVGQQEIFGFHPSSTTAAAGLERATAE
jgi:hypothetical protein